MCTFGIICNMDTFCIVCAIIILICLKHLNIYNTNQVKHVCSFYYTMCVSCEQIPIHVPNVALNTLQFKSFSMGSQELCVSPLSTLSSPFSKDSHKSWALVGLPMIQFFSFPLNFAILQYWSLHQHITVSF